MGTFKETDKIFCFGLGYSCLRLFEYLKAHDPVFSALSHPRFFAGTTTREEKAEALRSLGVEAHVIPRDGTLEEHALVKMLDGVSHLLLSAPPDEAGDPFLHQYGSILTQLPDLRWVGYLSTTGVYGDYKGAWVDEEAQLKACSERSLLRIKAEGQAMQLWRDHNVPFHIFRLSGIYGSERSALDQVRQGRARRIHKPEQVFNRIHVDDIAQVLCASMRSPAPGAIYNLADDEPAPSHVVTEYACRILGKDVPPMTQYEDIKHHMSPMARSFYTESKRIKNDKIKNELGIQLLYPNYKSGLEACLMEDERAG
jgi:hypothetical protein